MFNSSQTGHTILFCGHPWIPMLLHRILNIVIYILIIIESNTYPINTNCNKCYQCELNSHLVRILLMWCRTSRRRPIWLSGGMALKQKKTVFHIELKIAVIGTLCAILGQHFKMLLAKVWNGNLTHQFGISATVAYINKQRITMLSRLPGLPPARFIWRSADNLQEVWSTHSGYQHSVYWPWIWLHQQSQQAQSLEPTCLKIGVRVSASPFHCGLQCNYYCDTCHLCSSAPPLVFQQSIHISVSSPAWCLSTMFKHLPWVLDVRPHIQNPERLPFWVTHHPHHHHSRSSRVWKAEPSSTGKNCVLDLPASYVSSASLTPPQVLTISDNNCWNIIITPPVDPEGGTYSWCPEKQVCHWSCWWVWVLNCSASFAMLIEQEFNNFCHRLF